MLKESPTGRLLNALAPGEILVSRSFEKQALAKDMKLVWTTLRSQLWTIGILLWTLVAKKY